MNPTPVKLNTRCENNEKRTRLIAWHLYWLKKILIQILTLIRLHFFSFKSKSLRYHIVFFFKRFPQYLLLINCVRLINNNSDTQFVYIYSKNKIAFEYDFTKYYCLIFVNGKIAIVRFEKKNKTNYARTDFKLW